MTDSNSKASPSGDLGGEVVVADLVVAKLAGHAAQNTYGVVGMRRSPLGGLSRLLHGPFSEGVEVELHDGVADIELHVVMERGLNLAQVTENLEEQVRYQVEQVSGVRVRRVIVHVEDLHG